MDTFPNALNILYMPNDEWGEFKLIRHAPIISFPPINRRYFADKVVFWLISVSNKENLELSDTDMHNRTTSLHPLVKLSKAV